MVWVVSELYYPEDTSTGYYMTLVAEGVALRTPVRVITARPKYNRQSTPLPRVEIYNRVEIERCWCTTFNKRSIGLHIVNIFTTSLAIFFRSLRRLRKGDRVLVVTNPPLLPFVLSVVCAVRGATCYLRIDDVYPEAMINAGLIKANGSAAKFLNVLNRWLYCRMSSIIVLGRDMARLVSNKLNRADQRIVIIPNWADVDQVKPRPRKENRLLKELGIMGKFVLGYAGNIGRVQGIETLFAAALKVQELDDIHFVIVGSGQKLPWLSKAIADAGVKNITLAGQRPRSDQADFLNACDLGIVSLVPGMSGVGVPSRAYNLMAAGKPILAIVDEDSEIAMMVKEERVGWVVPPDAPDKIAEAIIKARSNMELLAEMGRSARAVAETKYSIKSVIESYQKLLVSSNE